MVKPYDVIKWQNVQKLCVNTLALPYTTSDEKFSLAYLIYLNLFKDQFWLRDLGLSTSRRVIPQNLEKVLKQYNKEINYGKRVSINSSKTTSL